MMGNKGLSSIKGNLSDINLIEVSALKWMNSSWEKITISDSTSSCITQSQISFITYNVWFENHNFNNRINAIFQILEKYNPDFICLQEVTNAFIQGLTTQKFMMNLE